ncbi:DUF5119 domain-containing protein [uncultured Bacteroides sp.]|uniref:DUF5119 domain-containing protein n=1 Tax=uncultured Bacteroides sp. TaxID=162156 RepID=UPI0025EB51B6|nr:DUF5119 domain-containing protein [uncultured Bacteroides sp.]
MIRTLRTLWTMLAALAFLTQSCQHKELCFHNSHYSELEIKFDWSNALDAQPSTMVVQIFRMDGSHYQRREFTSREGGKISIESGEYKILFHNGEMESVTERGNTFNDYLLATVPQSLLAPMGRGDLDTPPLPEGADDQPVRGVPVSVWGGKCDYLQVQENVSGQSLTLTPEAATVEYTVEVRNVENMSDLVDISAALSGMSEGWSPISGQPSGESVIMPLEMQRHADERMLVARFATFGHCPYGQEGKHTLTIYTSNQKYFHYDVTGQLHEPTDPAHILIVIDGLKIPSGDGGMSPSISGWDNVVETDIDMN